MIIINLEWGYLILVLLLCVNILVMVLNDVKGCRNKGWYILIGYIKIYYI